MRVVVRAALLFAVSFALISFVLNLCYVAMHPEMFSHVPRNILLASMFNQCGTLLNYDALGAFMGFAAGRKADGIPRPALACALGAAQAAPWWPLSVLLRSQGWGLIITYVTLTALGFVSAFAVCVVKNRTFPNVA